MIRPLRDNIVAVPIESIAMVGSLYLPDHQRQDLLQHRKAVVIYAGPKSECERGTVIHVKETWGEVFEHKGRKMWIGRSRDINGIVEGERVPDVNKYND